jgi:hypothetical protein
MSSRTRLLVLPASVRCMSSGLRLWYAVCIWCAVCLQDYAVDMMSASGALYVFRTRLRYVLTVAAASSQRMCHSLYARKRRRSVTCPIRHTGTDCRQQ